MVRLSEPRTRVCGRGLARRRHRERCVRLIRCDFVMDFVSCVRCAGARRSAHAPTRTSTRCTAKNTRQDESKKREKVQGSPDTMPGTHAHGACEHIIQYMSTLINID